MNILKILGNVLGIGKDYFANRARLKQAKSDQQHEIVLAETQSEVTRIKSNNDSDNSIDLITARNKKHTFKDEVLTYLFLMPVFVATIVPFFQAASPQGDWTNLNLYFKESYEALDNLPEWYKHILYAVVVDVLGFRSFARKIVDAYLQRKINITKNITK